MSADFSDALKAQGLIKLKIIHYFCLKPYSQISKIFGLIFTLEVPKESYSVRLML